MPLDRRAFLELGAAGAIGLALPDALPKRQARALRAAVRGPVFFPGTPGYGSARLVFNTRYDGIRPRAVVQVLDTRDVQAVVRWANRFGVRIVPRSGGHSYAGYSTTSHGVVLDLGRLRGIRLSGGKAQIGPGARLIDVYSKLAGHGLLIPAGSCPTVGIGGLALGGGHGLSGRRFGLTTDNLESAVIVTADGRARRVSAGAGEDLYWACRGGGGGNFGVVTSMKFRTHRAAGGSWFFIRFPWSQADEALAAWQGFAPHAPAALTSIFTLSSSGVTALGQYFGSRSTLLGLIRPLSRISGASVSSGSSTMMGLVERWAGHGPRTSFYAKSDYFHKPLPARARRLMIDSVRRAGAGALILDAYGGAYNEPAADATAFVHRDMLFSLQYYAAGPSWANGIWKSLRPYASGQAYQNYIDPQLAGWQRAYYGSNLARLREIKKQVDPDFLFRFRQAIPPAA
jgi:FAD/FMN-containing dehydrogenase